MTPDPAFARGLGDRLRGVLLTHAHEDHLGAVPHLWPRIGCPVYATPFAGGLLRRKLREAGVQAPLTEVPVGGGIELGPFRVLVDSRRSFGARRQHSRVANSARDRRSRDRLEDRSGSGRRAAHRTRPALQALGREGVLALVCDSTNAFVEGSAGSEAALRASLVEIVGRSAGRVAVVSFASNLARIATVARAAEECGRRGGAGRGVRCTGSWEIGRECGYLDDAFLGPREAASLPPGEVLMAVTGSQGEPGAALSRISAGNHPEIALEKGDTVIFSSREIPGNERAIRPGSKPARAARRGRRDGTGRLRARIRASGARRTHADVSLAETADPGSRSRERSVTCRSMSGSPGVAASRMPPVAENGTMLRFGEGGAETVGEVETGRLAVDGNRLVPLAGNLVRERLRLRMNGAATATLVLDDRGNLLAGSQAFGAGRARRCRRERNAAGRDRRDRRRGQRPADASSARRRSGHDGRSQRGAAGDPPVCRQAAGHRRARGSSMSWLSGNPRLRPYSGGSPSSRCCRSARVPITRLAKSRKPEPRRARRCVPRLPFKAACATGIAAVLWAIAWYLHDMVSFRA